MTADPTARPSAGSSEGDAGPDRLSLSGGRGLTRARKRWQEGSGVPQVMRAFGGSTARQAFEDVSSVLLLSQIVTATAAFVANILAARALGPSGRGDLALLLQIGYFGSLAVLLGCDRSVVAIYTGRPIGGIARAFLRLLVRPSAVTLLVAGIVIALPLPVIESWRTRLVLAAVFMVVNALDRTVRAVAVAARRAPHYLWYEVTREVLLLTALGVLMVSGHSNSTVWMAVYLFAGLIAAVIWLRWWTRPRTAARERPTTLEEERERRRRARREGLHLLPATVAHSGTLRVDRLILAALASTAALGLYATVGTMTELIAWPLMVFAESRLGAWRHAYDRGTTRFLGRTVALAVVYAVVAVCALSVALHWLLPSVLGDSFTAALPLILPLAVAAALFGFSQLFVNALTAIRRGLLASAVEVTGLVVSVIAYVGLIDRYGALGAAYGSLVGYATSCALACLLFVVFRRSAPTTATPVAAVSRTTGNSP